MIMPAGKVLLLPASPAFVGLSVCVAVALNVLMGMLPLDVARWCPDVLLLVVVFWCMYQPRLMGVGSAFFLGLMVDVHHAALLGQHALSYTVVAFVAVSLRRRLLWFPVMSQLLQVFPLFVLGLGLQLVVGAVASQESPSWWFALSPVLTGLLWPVASVVLLAPQRRPLDPDKNRPL
jgi:rod shape-determining protein MreD